MRHRTRQTFGVGFAEPFGIAKAGPAGHIARLGHVGRIARPPLGSRPGRTLCKGIILPTAKNVEPQFRTLFARHYRAT